MGHPDFITLNMAPSVTFLKVLLVFICLTILQTDSEAHPQCLDFRPPFRSNTENTMCGLYSSFGCCTANHSAQLRARYYNVISLLDDPVKSTCRGYLLEILCQECSPYAAHIYDGETTLMPKSFPGLCENYCFGFFDVCKSLIPHISTDLALNASMATRESFCAHVGLSDVDYCYPDLLHNPIMTKNITNRVVDSEGCLCLREFATRLQNPILVRSPRDGSGRMFIVEQTGKISIFYSNGTKLRPPFLNIFQKVKTSSSEGDERGLLGLTFHPEFHVNRKFYIYYSTSSTANMSDGSVSDHKSRVSEMQVSPTNPNRAKKSTERVLLEISQPEENHNGGEVRINADIDILYIIL